MPLEFTTSYVTDSLSLFRQLKKLAEGAMEQVPDEHLFTALDAEFELHRRERKAHHGQHAITLDGLSDGRWRKAGPAPGH